MPWVRCLSIPGLMTSHQSAVYRQISVPTRSMLHMCDIIIKSRILYSFVTNNSRLQYIGAFSCNISSVLFTCATHVCHEMEYKMVHWLFNWWLSILYSDDGILCMASVPGTVLFYTVSRKITIHFIFDYNVD